MSLIEEALRRLKDPILAAQSAPPSTAPKSKPNDTPAAAHSWSAMARRAAHPVSAKPQTVNALIGVTLVVLALAAVFLAGSAWWLSRTLSKSQAAPTPVVTPQPIMEVPSPNPMASQIPEPPLVSPVPSEPTPAPVLEVSPAPTEHPQAKAEILLTGIVEGSGEPYAVINGSIVGVGETVQGLTLLEIGNGSVKVRRPDGSDTTLSLPK